MLLAMLSETFSASSFSTSLRVTSSMSTEPVSFPPLEMGKCCLDRCEMSSAVTLCNRQWFFGSDACRANAKAWSSLTKTFEVALLMKEHLLAKFAA